MTPIRRALPGQAASDALGAELAYAIAAGFLATPRGAFDGFTIELSGGVGAGKTTIVRSLLRHLGVEGRIKSPTYTLVEPYVVELPKGVVSRQDSNLYCYHFDFYRFDKPHEWLDAGFRDYFSDAALRLVEWPERARSEGGSLLPAPDLQVSLEMEGDGRIVELRTHTALGDAWLSHARFSALPAAAAGGS